MLEHIQSLVDQLNKEIVICDLNHKILYMNQTAVENYKTRFGADLIGKNLLDCHNENSCAIKRKIGLRYSK